MSGEIAKVWNSPEYDLDKDRNLYNLYKLDNLDNLNNSSKG